MLVKLRSDNLWFNCMVCVEIGSGVSGEIAEHLRWVCMLDVARVEESWRQIACV